MDRTSSVEMCALTIYNIIYLGKKGKKKPYKPGKVSLAQKQCVVLLADETVNASKPFIELKRGNNGTDGLDVADFMTFITTCFVR
jgi:hypothetical protein